MVSIFFVFTNKFIQHALNNVKITSHCWELYANKTTASRWKNLNYLRDNGTAATIDAAGVRAAWAACPEAEVSRYVPFISASSTSCRRFRSSSPSGCSNINNVYSALIPISSCLFLSLHVIVGFISSHGNRKTKAALWKFGEAFEKYIHPYTATLSTAVDTANMIGLIKLYFSTLSSLEGRLIYIYI